METRLALTGNLAVLDAYVTDSSGNLLYYTDGGIQFQGTVNNGENIFVGMDFSMQDLPASASYSISYTCNGLTFNFGGVTAGAGLAGTWYTYYTCPYAFIATPGANQIFVSIDPEQSVAETTYADNTLGGSFTAAAPQVSGSIYSYSAAQIRAAYGVDSIPNFGSAAADGSGQTIAIVDAYNNPSALTDLDGFDQVMCVSNTSTQTLYQQYGPASSFLTVYNQSGTDITANIANSGSDGVPPIDPTGGWEQEESLDVQWAHAIAPGAKIDLIECDSPSNDDLISQGEITAAELPGVTVVSNSWSEGEWSGEASYDSVFTTPIGHPGVTFLAASGDSGAPSGYPAYSPNVVAVGGTQLTLNNDAYGSETGWNFPTPQTLDNGSSFYTQSGSWSSQAGGFSGAYSSAAGGSASAATWTTPISSSGEGGDGGVEVSATWVPAAGNATNATYDIYDGTAATGTLLAAVTVDQTQAPADISDGGTQFQGLGVYYPQSSTLTVVLSAAAANGVVVADAIGIAPDWAGSGGQSQVEPEPAYQLAAQNSGYRTAPDVSMDASVNSGVYLCYNGDLYYGAAGTSLASPCWAGLIAIANQGLVADGGTTLNSSADPTQTLQALYSLPAADFNDITSGYNGLSAGPGYDEVTGLGSPIANVLVPDLVSFVPLSLSQSSVSVGAASIVPGNTMTVTLTAKEADGSQEASGGLHVAFSLAAGSTGSGTFGAVVDNGDGTYSATFTGTIAGSLSIAAAVDGYSVTSTPPAVTVLPPAVTAVSTTETTGVYPAGTVIPITLTFNEAVTVTGTPHLALNAGSGATAVYSSGSGTSALTFSYTVAAGQSSSDLDYASIAALGLNGGSIQDANGNAAEPILPATGTDGLAIEHIVVATVPELTALLVENGLSERSYVDQLTFEFNEPVTSTQAVPMTLTDFGVAGNLDESVALTASQFQWSTVPGTGDSVLTWSLESFSGGTSSLPDGYYQLRLPSGVITDSNGTPLDGTGDGQPGGDYVADFFVLKGDVNGDGVVDNNDMLAVDAVLGSRQGSSNWNPNADLTRTGTVTTIDRIIVYQNMGDSITLPATQGTSIIAALPSSLPAWSFDGSTSLTATNSLPSGSPVNGIVFNAGAGAFVVKGNAVELGGEIVNQSPNTQTINLPMTLIGGSQTIDTLAGNVVIAGDISQSGGSLGITKNGSGTLTLSGANTYSGGTAVLAGVLQATNPDALPVGGSLTVAAGATLVLDSSQIAATAAETSSLAVTPAQSSAPAVVGQSISAAEDASVARIARTSLAAAPIFPAIIARAGIVPNPVGGDRIIPTVVPGHEVVAAPLSIDNLSKQGANLLYKVAQSEVTVGLAFLPAYAISVGTPPAVRGPKAGDDARQLSSTVNQAHDAVLQSRNTLPSVEKSEADAFWALDGSWSNGQPDKKHASIGSAVDAVMAILERMSTR